MTDADMRPSLHLVTPGFAPACAEKAPHALLGKSGKTGWTAVILLHKSAHLNCTPGQSVLWGSSQTGNPASAGHAPCKGVTRGKRMSATTCGARPGRGRRTAPPKPARHRPAMEIDGKGIVRSARRTLRSNSYKIYFQTIPPSPQNARECDFAHKLLAECGQSRARRPSGGLSAAVQGVLRRGSPGGTSRSRPGGCRPCCLPSDPTAPSEAVREQAARAGRPLPRRLAVIMPRPGSGGAGPAGLPPPLLTGLDHGRPCMIMPDRMVAAGPGS